MPLRGVRGGVADAVERRHREQSGEAGGGGVQGGGGAVGREEAQAVLQARRQSLEADTGMTYVHTYTGELTCFSLI